MFDSSRMQDNTQGSRSITISQMRGNNTVTETTASVSNESRLKREGFNAETGEQVDLISSSNPSIENQMIASHPNDIMIDPNWTEIDQSNIL